MSGARVWAVDDGGVVLVKDRHRRAVHDGYRGDEQGRYSRAWLNRDKVLPVKRSSLGYVPGHPAPPLRAYSVRALSMGVITVHYSYSALLQ
jgi:hypothetical protein